MPDTPGMLATPFRSRTRSDTTAPREPGAFAAARGRRAVVMAILFGACGDEASPPTLLDPADALSEVTAERDGADPLAQESTASSDGRPDDAAEDATAEVDSERADTSAPPIDYFDPGTVLEVSIAMAPDDWDALRQETRTLFDVFGPNCLAGPPAKVFNYFPADVSVGDITVTRAGVRKKGFFGSLDSERPSLRIEFDELVPGQRLDGLERMTLNNGRQDPSRLRQCLAYDIFRAAGVAAPRCTFAHVTVNGADLGLYVHVEPVRRRFLAASFGAPLGDAWEGQLSDFREGWLATFEPELNDDADPAPLEAVVAALAAPDESLIEALDQVIDLDQFMTFWASESLIGHVDGYAGAANNFFVYLDPRDHRLRFVPWGTDRAFVATPSEVPVSVLAVGALPHRLYAHPEGRARYRAELRRLLAEVWDEAALVERIGAWDALTRGAREPGSRTAGAIDVAALERFVVGRRAALAAELATAPDWPAPLRDRICAETRGTVTGAFETTWGTLQIENQSTGTGTLDLASDSLPAFTFASGGAKAGEDVETAPGRAKIVVAAPVVGEGSLVVIVLTALPIAPGERIIDGTATEAYVYHIESAQRVTRLGLLGGGTLVLDAADASPGAAVTGTFSAALYDLF